VLEGSGTLVTGGTIVNPQRRTSGQEEVTQINGPGVSGTAIDGGVSRRITKGDMVIIPAGTPTLVLRGEGIAYVHYCPD